MKSSFSSLLAFALSGALLSACGSTPTNTASQSANLTLVLNGVPQANVVVTHNGTTAFNGEVTGRKTLTALPRGTYTITAAALNGFTTPAESSVDLNGDQSVTLTYAPSGVTSRFDVQLKTSTVQLGPGDTLDLPFHVTAPAGYRGPVHVIVDGLSPYFTASSPTVDLTTSAGGEGHLTLSATRNAQSGVEYTARVLLGVEGEADSLVVQAQTALTLDVLPPLVSANFPSAQAFISEPTDIPITLGGIGYSGPATLSVDGVPEGVTMDFPSSVTLGPTASTVTLRYTAGTRADVGLLPSTLIITARGQRLFVPIGVDVQPQRYANLPAGGLYDLATDAAGNAWYSSWDHVQRITPTGVQTAYTTNRNLIDLQITADGQVYGASGGQRIVHLDPSTGQQQEWYLGQYDSPNSSDFNPGGQFVLLDATHLLFPANFDLTTYGFGTLDTTTGLSDYAAIAGLSTYPRAATRSGQGVYFIGRAAGSDRLFRLDLKTGVTTSYPNERTTGVLSMAVRPDGRLWLVTSRNVPQGGDSFTVARELVLFDPTSGQATVMPDVDVQEITRVVASPDGTAWLVDSLKPFIQHVDAVSGVLKRFTPALAPNRIAVSSQGDLWYSSASGETRYLNRLH